MTDRALFDVLDDMAKEFGRVEGFARTYFSTSVGGGTEQTLVRSLPCSVRGVVACVRACGKTRSSWFRDIMWKLSNGGYRCQSKSENEAWFTRALIDARACNAELKFLERLGEHGIREQLPSRALVDGRCGTRHRSERDWAKILRAARNSPIAWDICETSFSRRGLIRRGDVTFEAIVEARAFANLSRWSLVRVAVSFCMLVPRSHTMKVIPAPMRHRLEVLLGGVGYDVRRPNSRVSSRELILAKKIVPSASTAAAESEQAFRAITELKAEGLR